MLKLISYNIWHGLAGRGIFKFREFETSIERRLRLSALISLLRSELSTQGPGSERQQSAVVCLQEVNPLDDLGPYLLASFDLNGAFATDQAGLRFKGRGLPVNLQTGLTTAWSKDLLHLNELSQVVQLSGPKGAVGPTFSYQFEEVRMARIDRFKIDHLGQVAVVNLHLHHGFGRFPKLMGLLEAAVEKQILSAIERTEVESRLEAAERRRLRELGVLIEALDSAHGEVDFVFLLGDFNAVPESPEADFLCEAGFTDLTESCSFTWDPIQNPAPHMLQEGFEYPLPDFDRPQVRALYRSFDLMPRRIDAIWMKQKNRKAKVVFNAKLLGVKETHATRLSDEVSPSDHFGLAVQVQIEGPSPDEDQKKGQKRTKRDFS